MQELETSYICITERRKFYWNIWMLPFVCFLQQDTICRNYIISLTFTVYKPSVSQKGTLEALPVDRANVTHATRSIELQDLKDKWKQQEKECVIKRSTSFFTLPEPETQNTITDCDRNNHARMANGGFNKDSFITHWCLCLVSVCWGNTADPSLHTHCNQTQPCSAALNYFKYTLTIQTWGGQRMWCSLFPSSGGTRSETIGSLLRVLWDQTLAELCLLRWTLCNSLSALLN